MPQRTESKGGLPAGAAESKEQRWVSADDNGVNLLVLQRMLEGHLGEQPGRVTACLAGTLSAEHLAISVVDGLCATTQQEVRRVLLIDHQMGATGNSEDLLRAVLAEIRYRNAAHSRR